ncbi:MAG TPA: heavy metal translocating P-type ATPase [Gemmatimonadaceae bacterium]
MLRSAEARRAAAGVEVACSHCGLPVPSGYVEDGADQQFCCAGCRTAWSILHEHGLERYYDLPDRRDRPVRSSGRRYDDFDHPAFHKLYVSTLPSGISRVELFLEGVHCASCVWLVERVPLVIPGVIRAELDVRRSLATVEWDPGTTPLSAIARGLDALGYPAHPFRGMAREHHRRREDRAMLTRIGVAGALSVNVMLASLALYSGWWSGMEAEFARFFRWTAMALTLPSLVWPGRVFFTSAFGALRTRTLHMDLPIAVALGAGFARGAVNTFTDTGPVYFDGVAMLVFLLLCGRYLQLRGQRAAADSAELLFSLTPSVARVVGANGAIREAPAEGLLPGDLVEVRPGDTFPADGVVESGVSSVNVALLTGESRPVAARAGAAVYSGTLNLESALRVRVTEPGEASRLAKLVRQVEEGARRRAPMVLFADRLSGWFTAVVLVLAAIVAAVWMQVDPSRAIDNAIALLVVTCPCALALATPLAVTAAVGRAARRGILIKGGDALERLARPSTLLLDKTGTITEGAVSMVQFDGPDWVKPLVIALESESSHPLASAFRQRLGPTVVPPVSASRHVIGSGIIGQVDGRDVVIGKPAFVASLLGNDAVQRVRDDRLTEVWIAVDGDLVGRALFGDAVRRDAAESIARLTSAGWQLGIASGDSQNVVDAVAADVGIPGRSALGDATPEDKLAIVGRMSVGGPVVMVGDGVNDAAAIAASSVGVAVHGGAEASLAAADVYLTRPGLWPLVELIEGSRRTLSVIRRGIWWSLGYNLVGVGLAMFGLITPLVAAVMMPASSLTVLLVAWKSRTFDVEAVSA